MSRLFADLETILKQMLSEHRLMVSSLEKQQAAMRKLDLPTMHAAAREQEACRLRVVSMETRRRIVTEQLRTELRVQGPLTLSRLAALHPPGGAGLLQLGKELRAAVEDVRGRAYVAGRLANAVLGHLNTMVRLFSGAVEKAGLYTRHGTPRVSSRIGLMEAIGQAMSLIGALNNAATALAVQQAAIQTTGNNISNAGDADYSRQVSNISPGADQQLTPGIFLGTGVDLTSVQRQVDDALNTRLNAAVSDTQAASTSSDWLTRIQTTFNELGSDDLSTSMSTFFGSWSSLANNPQDAGLRQVVVQDGQSLASSVQSLRSQVAQLQGNVDDELKTQTSQADTLASQVAALNGKIVVAEGGSGGQANSLRDQRDALLKQLSGLMNIQTVQQTNGVVNVYVGSEPLVSGTQSAGVALRQDEVNGELQSTVVFKSTNGNIQLSSGSLKGLVDARTQVSTVVGQIDSLAHNLIFELNKLHSSGQGLEGFTSTTATNAVSDPTAALNSAKAGLSFTPTNGSFVVHVTDQATGQVTSTLVQVPLTGAAGDATLNSLTASLGAISGVDASVNGGKLTVAAANNGVTVSFSQDSSGVLAALGINSFFSGNDATDIAVNSQIAADPSLVAAGKNGDANDNQTATAIANLESDPVAALNGVTLTGAYQSMVNGVSTKTAAAKNNADAADAVQDTLQSQRDSLSGVSVDEESINLLQQQRAYQGAARVISTVDQLMQTLLALPI